MFKLKQSEYNEDIESVSDLSINDLSDRMPSVIPNKYIQLENNDEEALKGFVEVSKSDLDQLQIGDFIRYTKLDGKLMKGGYINDIFNKTNTQGEENTYIKISYNKSKINNVFSGYTVKLNTIIKLYKKLENNIEFNMINNNLNGINENINSDINIIYDLVRNRDTEIELLKQKVTMLENINKKNKKHFIQLIEQINFMNNKINQLLAKK